MIIELLLKVSNRIVSKITDLKFNYFLIHFINM
jgi:hypothetical protein